MEISSLSKFFVARKLTMLYLEDNYALTSEKKIQKAIAIVADCNKYHPIQDYLNSLEWDGTERIRHALRKYLGAEESEYVYQCLRLFMLGAIHRVFKAGCKFEVIQHILLGVETDIANHQRRQNTNGNYAADIPHLSPVPT